MSMLCGFSYCFIKNIEKKFNKVPVELLWLKNDKNWPENGNEMVNNWINEFLIEKLKK